MHFVFYLKRPKYKMGHWPKSNLEPFSLSPPAQREIYICSPTENPSAVGRLCYVSTKELICVHCLRQPIKFWTGCQYTRADTTTVFSLGVPHPLLWRCIGCHPEWKLLQSMGSIHIKCLGGGIFGRLQQFCPQSQNVPFTMVLKCSAVDATIAQQP